MLTGTDFVDDIRGLDTRFPVIVGDKDPRARRSGDAGDLPRVASERAARDDTELRTLPDAGRSAECRDDRRGFPAGRGRLSVAHARRPVKAVLAAAA
ncbi:hypothetical protein [Burkholderia sp. HI2500]|uniref:hypothetical protein n=1 Tax=Burkholderia sp. HI2500 TaxID=2015358 RepID=UPI0015C5D4B1|nr:hypothetical protein [Burkholderia sp. HI2500]